MDIADLPEGHYVPDGKGWWKLKVAYHYQQDRNGDWHKVGKNEYHEN